MEYEHDNFVKKTAKKPSLRPVIYAVLVAFLFGLIIAAYAVQYYNDNPEKFGLAQTDTTTAPASEGQTSEESGILADLVGSDEDEAQPSGVYEDVPSEAIDRVEEQQGGIDQRLAAAEQRLARLDLQSQAAAGNAARAEGLLIAFAARRSLERGAELGFLADQLRLRFGDALPNAVSTVISFSRDPVTMDELIARLEMMGPQLSESDAPPSFARMRRELASLFVIRRDDTPSSRPQRRLERARLFLESGRVEPAIAEVRNLPGAERGRGWIEAASRYAEAHRALDLIETSAVLEPRRLRDGEGNRVEQPSPVEADNAG
ncbi:hypothetical protein [Parapontixanthobacter aurantiacus]|uniref:hypothetical protein n=1 Tax=Parapontixanthobacter aurantiacus TaxID=1463599 RepID=UPI001925FFAC|nr:hypothetical protein [Parapontixanthobacter aurantiacus]